MHASQEDGILKLMSSSPFPCFPCIFIYIQHMYIYMCVCFYIYTVYVSLELLKLYVCNADLGQS